ncbi:hypothetical protein L895_14020, partial [Staphylococcus aureus SA16]
CNYIKTKLEELDNTLGKGEPFLNDLKPVSPILDNHLDDIVKNMKHLILRCYLNHHIMMICLFQEKL